jgi:hypothetical protein
MSTINSSAANGSSTPRLVHRPTATPNGSFIGWGPKLGSI